MKYIAILAVILAVCLYFAIDRLVIANDKINTLESEKTALIDEINRRNKNVLELSKQNAELEKAAAKDKKVFDWNFDISNTAVVKQLRSN